MFTGARRIDSTGGQRRHAWKLARRRVNVEEERIVRSSYPRSEARTRCNIKGEGFSAVFAKLTTKLMEAALNKAYHRVCFGDRQEVALGACS